MTEPPRKAASPPVGDVETPNASREEGAEGALRVTAPEEDRASAEGTTPPLEGAVPVAASPSGAAAERATFDAARRFCGEAEPPLPTLSAYGVFAAELFVAPQDEPILLASRGWTQQTRTRLENHYRPLLNTRADARAEFTRAFEAHRDRLVEARAAAKPASGAAAITVEQYGAMVAEIEVKPPDQHRAVYARYGITPNEKATLDAKYGNLFTRDGDARLRFREAKERALAFLKR
ncbi:MAG: hypothetical protein U0414_00425 [Polyangiaceae bacterium]